VLGRFDADEGELGAFAGPLYEAVSLDPIGSGVTSVIELDGCEDLEPLVTEHVVEMLAGYFVESTLPAAAILGADRKQQIGSAHFGKDEIPVPYRTLQREIELPLAWGEEILDSSVSQRRFFAKKYNNNRDYKNKEHHIE